MVKWHNETTVVVFLNKKIMGSSLK